MLNYVSAKDGARQGKPLRRAYDIASDLRGDLHGLAYTLLAVAEQPCEIQGEQLAAFSEQVGFMEEAVAQVMDDMERAKRDADENKGDGERKGERDLFARVCDLEYTAMKARDALRTVCASLDVFFEAHAAGESTTEADLQTINGVTELLRGIADTCDKAASGAA